MEDFERSPERRTAGPGPNPQDAAFHALAHPYRRFILRYLGEVSEEATIGEVAAAVSSSQGMAGDAGPGGRDVATIESSLYHVHVPKLTEADLVAFDPDEGTVHATPRTAIVLPMIETARQL